MGKPVAAIAAIARRRLAGAGRERDDAASIERRPRDERLRLIQAEAEVEIVAWPRLPARAQVSFERDSSRLGIGDERGETIRGRAMARRAWIPEDPRQRLHAGPLESERPALEANMHGGHRPGGKRNPCLIGVRAIPRRWRVPSLSRTVCGCPAAALYGTDAKQLLRGTPDRLLMADDVHRAWKRDSIAAGE